MITERGIAVDAWVLIDSGCSLTCDVIGDQAQFNFGHRTGSLHLYADEQALAELARLASEAHTRFQAIPEGEPVEFTVTA